MNKFFAVVALMLAFAVSGFAQTTYTTSQFSAAFNGSVRVDTFSNPTNTNVRYQSTTPDGVTQAITVRTVDHDIAVSTASSDFYMSTDPTGGTVRGISRGTYQGHPYTYAFHDKVNEAGVVEYSVRVRYIIVSSREVIFIEQVAPETLDDQQEWFRFEASLGIN